MPATPAGNNGDRHHQLPGRGLAAACDPRVRTGRGHHQPGAADTQIAEANKRLVDTVGQGGANFVQNAIVGPLEPTSAWLDHRPHRDRHRPHRREAGRASARWPPARSPSEVTGDRGRPAASSRPGRPRSLCVRSVRPCALVQRLQTDNALRQANQVCASQWLVMGKTYERIDGRLRSVHRGAAALLHRDRARCPATARSTSRPRACKRLLRDPRRALRGVPRLRGLHRRDGRASAGERPDHPHVVRVRGAAEHRPGARARRAGLPGRPALSGNCSGPLPGHRRRPRTACGRSSS